MVRLLSLAIFALALTMSPAARGESMVLCNMKFDYRPVTEPNPLIGIWVGEILGFNVSYAVDYRRCIALAIERIGKDGGVVSKMILADSTKNVHTGTSYGTQGYVHSWTGKLSDSSGTKILFSSTDGNTVYEFQLVEPRRMEGRVSYAAGNGRLFLTKR